ncbi:coiled-coil domain-containing protein 17 [Guaruba guarouba]
MQGPRRARGAPLGDVLTPRERALLRAAPPASRRATAEDAPAQRPAPPQGHRQRPRELVEAHDRHMAEIQARTQQLEQQREGLCQRLAALRAQAAVDPHCPKQGDAELTQAPAAQQDLVRHLDAAHRQATLHLDTLLPAPGPLAAEARALHLSYLRAGGHDPHILEQLLHLQVEATVLEKGLPGQRRGRRMGKHQPQPHCPALYPPLAAESPQLCRQSPAALAHRVWMQRC